MEKDKNKYQDFIKKLNTINNNKEFEDEISNLYNTFLVADEEGSEYEDEEEGGDSNEVVDTDKQESNEKQDDRVNKKID